MIRLEELRKSYRDGAARFDVLRGVSLSVNEGDLVAVMGASGSGKSTLLNVIGGLDRDYEGRATVLGSDLASLSDAELARYRNGSVGFVFQSFNLIPPLSVLQNVLLPSYFAEPGKESPPRQREGFLRAALRVAGLSAVRSPPARTGRGAERAGLEDKAREALARVGLSGMERRLPGQLSGGERQRVALARALFRAPKLLLADEPTGSLDPETAAEVIQLLQTLNVRDGLTVILVTHDDRVAAVARRILRLRDGLLTEDAIEREAAIP